MKKLLAYLKHYKKECVLAPFFKLLEASFELTVPLIVAAIIDNGITAGNKKYVALMCGLLVAFGIIGLCVTCVAQYFSAKAATGFAGEIRSALFSHIQKLSFTELDNIGPSTLITRMTSDVNQVQNGLNLTLRLVMRSPFVVFGAMIMAFTINVKQALIFVAVIPILAAIVFAIMLTSIPLYKKVQSGLDKLLGITGENLSGVRVIRAFCKEDGEINDFCDANSTLTAMQKKVGRISALMNPATYVVINLAVIALIKLGALQVNTGIITQGAVVALYNYMSQILVELIKLANLIINLTKSVACGKRIQAVLDTESSVVFGTQNPSAENADIAVEFDNVNLRYASSKVNSLSNINFRAKKGSVVGVIGGTGSGKTSLVNMIPRFYDATQGTVSVNGVDVKNYGKEQLRKKIGIVPQKAVLFSGTVKSNMLWGNENATDDEIYAALKTAQAFDFIEQKGEGLDLDVEQNGKNFSGGQRQRLTIARALVRKPEILILDDSSSALDYATDLALRRSIKGLDYSPTVFIVSQRTASVQSADEIIVLDDGEAVGIGTHEELLKNCDVYKEIYYSQFKEEA